jgi:hypothetical protein
MPASPTSLHHSLYILLLIVQRLSHHLTYRGDNWYLRLPGPLFCNLIYYCTCILEVIKLLIVF